MTQHSPLIQQPIHRPESAMARMSQWEAMSIRGPQREKFAKGLVSNKIREIPAGAGNATLILTTKGRIISELLFFVEEDRFVFFAPPHRLKHALHFFEHYHVIEDIEIRKEDTLGLLLLAGEGLAEKLEQLSLALPDFVYSTQKEPKKEAGAGVIWTSPEGTGHLYVTRSTLTDALPMAFAWGDNDTLAQFQEQLGKAGVRELTPEQLEGLQTELGWRDTERELAELLVHEAALQDTHVHFNKGCWVGQEVVARTQYRGQANKGLFLLGGVSEEQLETPAQTIVDREGTELGKVLCVRRLWNGERVLSALLKLKAMDGETTLFLEGGRQPLSRLMLGP